MFATFVVESVATMNFLVDGFHASIWLTEEALRKTIRKKQSQALTLKQPIKYCEADDEVPALHAENPSGAKFCKQLQWPARTRLSVLWGTLTLAEAVSATSVVRP
jgi:hypothetical protein